MKKQNDTKGQSDKIKIKKKQENKTQRKRSNSNRRVENNRIVGDPNTTKREKWADSSPTHSPLLFMN